MKECCRGLNPQLPDYQSDAHSTKPETLYITSNFLKVVVCMIIINQWNQTARLYELQLKVIYSHAILVTVTQSAMWKRLSVKPGLGHWQTVQTQISKMGCLIKVCTICLNYKKLKIIGSYRLDGTVLSPSSGPFSRPTLRDNQPTSQYFDYSCFQPTNMCIHWLFQTLEGSMLSGEVLISGGTNWDLVGRNQIPKGGM